MTDGVDAGTADAGKHGCWAAAVDVGIPGSAAWDAPAEA